MKRTITQVIVDETVRTLSDFLFYGTIIFTICGAIVRIFGL